MSCQDSDLCCKSKGQNYAEIYDSAGSFKVRIFSLNTKLPRLIEKLEWKAEENILDYGCGTGQVDQIYLYDKVTETNSKLYGIDISGDMITYAQKTYPHPNVEYIKTTLVAEDFPL